ncbi:peptidoglycan-binding protein [Rhizobium lentis]|uniref:Peptidoglycan hydrolase-like protein with peptidoglycan-binding domain n=1 Tax=Rhizobium lentis TaxID=1138194 RepID=A0A7W8UMQ6_9HYPH|nr:peptidoglycan-binding protein [Rhizobium lentis]MBB4573982.1 peptidoglycan hydrolase-like protein with peptidoglycan-binding domain [Rhizobium lentis]MBB5549910.1 peptidoglycan hydrolase-like protein with peptidoglycan-binding domain [Rhizobium lentis]MBB5560082.1 peptidoglycan hydrolase-like protein with peptidoglycan-binding domain [Rhizobium lentis]MBB5567030.1 peptidoglycan hydrolase-like protein with peptidoglycan-binding domain [Rhizobium lentis]
MAARKRKSPKGKNRRQQPGLVVSGAAALGSLGLQGASALGGLGLQGASVLGGVIGRNPSVAGGTIAFFVIFSFVAANALWYQPGLHPHPIFRTRDPQSPSVLGARRPAEEQQGDVTTFRIERPEDAATTSATPAPAAPTQQPSELVMGIQQQLVRRGLYNGVPDGIIGPRTSAAILFFQETVGMAQTGEATPEVLAALKTDAAGPSTVPVEKPREDVSSKAAAEDPVAAAIRSAEKTVKTAPPAAKQLPSSELTAVDLVLKIQKGLSNMAYANVGVDGVAGEQTRAAIRHFQKHYNLPENGEPNEAVLKKLKEIGAI